MRRQLAALFLFCVIDTLGFGILIPLVPYMAGRFGIEPQYITPILGSYSLCQLLAAPFWGHLSDRYGRRPILMSSLAGACLSYVLLGFAGNAWWLLASRVLAGLMAGNISAAFAYAADVSTPEKRAGTFGLVGAAIGIGFTLGPPVGGLLAGKDAASANFVAPAVVSCAPEPARHRAGALRAAREPHRRAPRAAPAGERGAAPGGCCASGRRSRTSPPRRSRSPSRRRFSSRSSPSGPGIATASDRARSGFLLFAVALPALIMQGGVVRLLAPRVGEVRLATAGVLSLRGRAHRPGHRGLLRSRPSRGCSCAGSGLGAYNPSASALASRQSRGHDRGAVLGAYVASGSLARVFGPFTSGALYALLGPAGPFLIGACVTLPAVWLLRRAQPAPD